MSEINYIGAQLPEGTRTYGNCKVCGALLIGDNCLSCGTERERGMGMSEIPERISLSDLNITEKEERSGLERLFDLGVELPIPPGATRQVAGLLARAEQRIAALEAENGRLRAPVSDAEWEAANYRQAVETGLGESSTDGKMLVWHTYTRRDKFNALIAARAQQPSPAQDKEQP